jgi:hypothetical protein
MSGGSGGVEPPGGGETDCLSIHITTNLSSPDPDVLRRISRGDVLRLRLEGERGPLVAVAADGQPAGSITALQLTRLIECIKQGFSFVGVVQEVAGGMCRVEVRPESR